MKLYLDVAEVYNLESLLHRAELANEYEVEPAIAYLFFAQFAEASVRTIAQLGCEGNNFLTFVPPSEKLIAAQLRQLWGNEPMVRFSMSGISWRIGQDINYIRILNTVETAWYQAGLDRKEAALKTKVSLIMNTIGNATICVEC